MTKPAISAPIIGIVGWKNSGKTTLAAALIAEFTTRGYRVASIKSAHHAFTIDDPKTDSGKHAAAGAVETAILGGPRWAVMHHRPTDDAEATLEDILTKMSPCDLIIAEGFKTATHTKIEVRGSSADTSHLADTDTSIFAIACDGQRDSILPTFPRDAVNEIADFVMTHLALQP
ncbi:MAG: molybdopterin-guanine dinucleotide biosynthesis protein B [Pseudomonadota bacterium]